MDKIREWGLPVKNHMVELEESVIEDIRSRLSEETESKTKKKATKKKTAAKKKTAKKKTATKKKAVKKKTTTVVGAKEPASTTTAKKATKKKSTVIRRKKSEIEAAKEKEAQEKAEAIESNVATEASTSEAPQVEASQVASSSATETQASEKVEAKSAESKEAEAAPKEEAKATEEKAEAKPTAARKVAVNVADGESSGVKSTPKNIIGRMDLSRLKTPEKSNNNRNNDSDSDVRSPRTGARNIRPGFVAAPQPVLHAPEPEKKKFDDKKTKKAAGGAKDTGQTQSFSTTEFRKREMVFQPKKKKGTLSRESKKTEITTPKASKRIVKVNNSITVASLAQEMSLKTPQLMKALMKNGVMAKANDVLDFDTVALIVPELGWEAQNVHRTVDELLEASVFGKTDAELVTRPPVVTVMGHVDHGKTTLLDSIRKANVVSGEAGGITQHIAAYRVQIEQDKVITFIDTPGHEAFTAMRARGANVTDIAIIVVAADDGVMPQTIEAINHAKAAEVPIVVAVNKVDKPDANPDKIMQQLTEHEIVPEEWGGDTIFVPVSALKGDGIDKLLEQIHLLAELSELKANPKRSGTGIVIESRMEKGRGFVATLLVQEGTIETGQYIVAGKVAGKIRSLLNDQGKMVKDAGPSVPVEMLGLSAAPVAGDRFDICEDESKAKEIAEARASENDVKEQTPNSKMSLDALFAKVKSSNVKELPVILKTDVAGSGEAIRGMFEKLETEEVKVKIIHNAVGAISESDVLLASSAGGIVFGFNVRPDSGATRSAEKEGVEIKTYRIVYELVDDIKKAMSGLLDPDIVENVHGKAEVRETFSVPKIGMIGGCSVIEGKISRNHLARLTRNGVVVYEGKISSLKRFKDDVKEVQQGYECGIGIENFNDLKNGDVIEAYSEESVAREL